MAGSFSVYAIKTHESDASVLEPRKTFRFLSNNFEEYEHTGSDDNPMSGYYISDLYKFPNKADEMVSFQIVKNEEKLQPVVIPPNFSWGHFYGWYIVELDLAKSKAATAAATGRDIASITEDDLTQFVYEWPEEPVQVDSVTPIEVTRDETVYLAPLYSNYRFVTFHETDHEAHYAGYDEEACNIITRKIIVLGSNGECTVDISDIIAPSPSPQSLVFYGWRFRDDTYQTRLSTGDVVHQTITVTKDDISQQVGQGDEEDIYSVDLYPVFKGARWIYFVHGEADWNAQYVSALFAFLYEPSVPEDQRVSVSQLPSTIRPGYKFDGWWTGYLDENDHIVYGQQVSMGFDEEGAEGNSQIISTAGEKIYLSGGGDNNPDNDTYIFKGRLYLREGMTLYAKWEPVDHADYKVVVWKQRVTDSKNAVDSEKQYDYYDYRMIENTSTGTIILDSDEFKALGFENLTESSDSEIRDDFNFFHYSRTTVDVGRNTYNGSNPSERVQGVVAPDSSTVVNIYYDRDLMAINLYYSSNAPSGSSTAFTYTETDAVNTNTTYYGLTPNGYQALIRESTPNEYYTYTYRYSPTSAANQNNMYGVVNDEYVLLSSRSIYVWTPQYVYTPVNKATYSSNGYAVYNGEYVTAYYNNGGWYRTRSLSWFTYTYSDPVDGDVFSREEGSEFYTGTRYTRSGSRAPYTYTATTATNNTQYMVDSYGGHIQLTRSSSYAYSYNNADYTGQRYTRTTNSDNSLIYEGTLYKKVNGTMVEIAEGESYTGTVYGRDSDSHYEELTRRTEAACKESLFR